MDESETAYEVPTRRSLDEVPVEENPEAVKEVERIIEAKRGESPLMEAAARQIDKKKKARKKKAKKKKKAKRKAPTDGVPLVKRRGSKKKQKQLPDEYKNIEYYYGEQGTTFQYRKDFSGFVLMERDGHKIQVPWGDLLRFITKEVIAKKLHARIDELAPEELLGIPNLVLYPPNLELVRQKLKKTKSQDPGEVFETHLRDVRDRAGHKFPSIKNPPSFMRRAKRKKEPDFSGLVMTNELLEILGVRMATLFNWRDNGFFPQPKKVEGKNFWPKEVVKDWLRSHYKKGGRWFARRDRDPQTEFQQDWAKKKTNDTWEQLAAEAATANFDLQTEGEDDDE
jgi:predicted DNA-binding transcriptional regulator AlpA